MLKRLLIGLVTALLAFPALAQIPGGSQIQINRTPITGGTTALCLYDNAGKVGEQACGTGTASNIQVGTTTVGGGTTLRLLYDNAGVLGESSTWTLGTSGTLLVGTAGTLADAASALTVTATQSSSATATQIGAKVNITSAGSAAQDSRALSSNLLAGYTGSSATYANYADNVAAGVGSTPFPSSSVPVGNIGVSGSARATTTGTNIGVHGRGDLGDVSIGVAGYANTNKTNGLNIGGAFSAQNSNSGGVMIGAFISLRQTTNPAVSAALLVDNSSVAQPIAIFRDNGTAVFTIADGGAVTATAAQTFSNASIVMSALPSDAATTTNTVCRNSSTNGLSVGSGTIGICLGTSSARYKHAIAPLQENALAEIGALRPVRYRYNAGYGTTDRDLYGFLAEDMAKVVPDLVGLDTEGRPNSIDMVGLIPVMALAIQQLREEITILKGR